MFLGGGTGPEKILCPRGAMKDSFRNPAGLSSSRETPRGYSVQSSLQPWIPDAACICPSRPVRTVAEGRPIVSTGVRKARSTHAVR